MSEIYELDSGDYKPVEVDWIKNDQRGNLNLDWEKWWFNEKNSLDVKVEKQLKGFEKNIMDNIFPIPEVGQSRNPLRIRFMRDFDELAKQLTKAINNAKLGPASKKTLIGVAENLRTNEIDGIKQSLIIQGFDEKLIPDGNIKVAYYDNDSNYTPKDSWTVKNDARASFITHNETGLVLKLDRNGLSFVDDGNFKVNNKKIDYESIYTPRNVNLYPTGDEFDPMEGYDGPAYDAQTMDRDIPIYEDVAENIDKQTGTPGIGAKALDVVGKVFGPVDEIVMKSLSQGLPKLFAGTALAGVMGGAGAALAQGLVYWSVGNLALAAVRGAGTFAAQYGGDTTKAIDAILAGEIPEKTFEEAVKESFGEGMEQFSNQMQYDPFYMAIDKTIEKASGGVVEGQDPISVFKGIQHLLGGK